ncbi:hypothetical protein, partial [Streptomyces griseoluteus]|uniref:hypothetical protein n=1 Tax=Streptomyces griseoluteus TaxID=29306 RepID=UPI0036ACF6AE
MTEHITIPTQEGEPLSGPLISVAPIALAAPGPPAERPMGGYAPLTKPRKAPVVPTHRPPPL